MKMLSVLIISAFLCVPNLWAQQQTAPLKTEKDKQSYVIGLNLGADMKRRSVEDLNFDMLIRGIRDAYSGGNKLLTEEEQNQIWAAFQKSLAEKQKVNTMKTAEENKKKSDAFLAENKNKEGVVTTASGLQYKVLRAGKGPKPKLEDTVTTHYRGTLLDGTEFDSSYRRNEPVSFKLSGVISGWTEALLLMETGSKWQLFIPADLAYGPKGAGGLIGPNETLIFEVELISIQPAAGPKQ
ncbi:FKBP-type peptidyl-prolyl cis-trans isomerase [bacterium]|nr:FKBP-type peptidyl-prolyl cis-trans isomerase [bacterium]MCI0614911.1 FKBP-type peptidyl-prolyl cis-trans isomerase [bacterium]